jgi:two-component system response regulator CpxR
MSTARRAPESIGDHRARVRLLVIDDDVELCALLDEYMNREGFDLQFAHDGRPGLEAALDGKFEAIVLDVMLPDVSGFQVLRAIRAKKRTPILMLTARGDHVDRVVGLEMGADDYVPKPFNPRELVARIRAVLRRAESAPETESRGSRRIAVGEIAVDLETREAWSGPEPVQLTPIEFDMLVALMNSAGRLLTRDQIARAALGRPVGSEQRSSVDKHICNLRRKLGAENGGGSHIRTVRSAGYLLPRAPE